MSSRASRPSSLRVLIVDDDASVRRELFQCLEADGHRAVDCAAMENALTAVAREAFDLIYLEMRPGMQNGLDLIPRVARENPWTRIVALCASIDTAVEALKCGASDLLPKPLDATQIRIVTQRIAERRQLERQLAALRSATSDTDPEADLPTADPALIATLQLARQVASTRANLILQGELGTGKGRLARAIHLWSHRANEPFAEVCCRADSGDAAEAELFGGVANGPEDQRAGVVELCDGGTLLLDEIGELSLRLQPRILRLLKEQEFERQPQNTGRRADVRVIATTSTNLEHAVAAGTFRADLLLALGIVQLDLPPLRLRPQDITLLAERYLALFSRQNRRSILGFTPAARYALQQHQWPGNARELRNVIERAVLGCKTDLIGVENLPGNLLNNTAPNLTIGDLVPLAEVEELHIRRVVASARSLRQAASILGIDSGTLVRRMKRYRAGDDQPAT